MNYLDHPKLSRWHILWLDRKYEIRKRWEAFLRWIAWHLPWELVMWCYYRVAAHATTGEYGNTTVHELSMMDAIQRWDTAKK